MRKWLLPLVLPALLSCEVTNNDGFYQATHIEKGEIDSYELPRHAINDVVKGLAYQMLTNSSFVNAKTPVAVASFVDLNNLEKTNWLGNQLAESFIHELQRHGLVVIDYKTTGHIRVTKEGDFVFSRDWQELPERQIIDYIVSGTMVEQENGILVNARMIGIQSKVVVATAQSFIPRWVLGDVMSHSENVKMRDGMIIRDNAMLYNDDRAVVIQN
ncbi:FlgO family outer membrane protein [Colwellia piezophila]|uniref:FlgO family outer membrane protein n=1 Tax=Colwellia piezophila TaxID=211668 RepID=UPI000366C44A|nr:FlgO family outer membrane protein [Colwellia piezophila]